MFLVHQPRHWAVISWMLHVSLWLLTLDPLLGIFHGVNTVFEVTGDKNHFRCLPPNSRSLFATRCRTTWWTKETWWCMTALRRWRSLRTFNAWVRCSVLMEPKQDLNRDSFPRILYWIPWIKTTSSSSSLDTREVERHVSCWSTARRHAQVRGDWCYWRSVEGVSTCVWRDTTTWISLYFVLSESSHNFS